MIRDMKLDDRRRNLDPGEIAAGMVLVGTCVRVAIVFLADGVVDVDVNVDVSNGFVGCIDVTIQLVAVRIVIAVPRPSRVDSVLVR